MEWLNSVLGVIMGVLTLAGIVAGALSVFLKRRNKGQPTELTTMLDTTSNVIDHSLDIIKLIPDLIVKAEEQYGRGNGLNKLEYVLTKLQLYALQNKVDYKEEELKDYIEKVIYTTKTVNVDKEG